MIANLLVALALFVLANLVTYGIVNGLNFNEIPPGFISIMIQIGLYIILYMFNVTIPYFAELILAELIVVLTNSTLKYLTGTTF